MMQWVRALAAMLDGLSLIPGTYIVKENIDSGELSSDFHKHAMECRGT